MTRGITIAGMLLMAGPLMSSELEGQTWVVELEGIVFTPRDITIDVSDTVRWVWISGFHNVESGIIVGGSGVHDGNFRSGNPTGTVGTTFELVFDQEFLDATPMADNTYPFYCVVHDSLGMAGTVTVIKRGDVTRDGRIDLDDYGMLFDCLSGPGDTEGAAGCTSEKFNAADLDAEGHVDLKDVAVLLASFEG